MLCGSTGGVTHSRTEPRFVTCAGTISIKFKLRDLQAAAHRLDPVLREASEKLAGGTLSREERVLTKVTPMLRMLCRSSETCARNTPFVPPQARVSDREKALLPVYQQLATTFADLHDRPGRMKAKVAPHRDRLRCSIHAHSSRL